MSRRTIDVSRTVDEIVGRAICLLAVLIAATTLTVIMLLCARCVNEWWKLLFPTNTEAVHANLN